MELNNKNNPSAYPTIGWEQMRHGEYMSVTDDPGMTLLDFFAAKAMQGICADGHTFWDSNDLMGKGDLIADLAYRIALSMLEERQKHIK